MIDTDKALLRVADALSKDDSAECRQLVEELFPEMLNEISSLRTSNSFLELQVTELETKLKDLEE